jgi:hypothetical protein
MMGGAIAAAQLHESCRSGILAGELPFRCRHKFSGDSGRHPDLDFAEDEDAPSLHPPLQCVFCSFAITSETERIEVNGAHRHTFFNPAGIVFELRCFLRAPGCLVGGEWTADFTWFAGHVWSVALCGSCRAHLGWCFSFDDTSFFGLIGKNLRSG